jgi:isoaspartyl peptidase/L-asparaginase-like protein (Ntn-hydrolase superfamily)
MDDIMPLVVRMMETSARPSPHQLMQEAAEDSSSEMEDDVTVVEFLGSDSEEEEEEEEEAVSSSVPGAWWRSGGDKQPGRWGSSSRSGAGQWAREEEVGVYATQRGVLYGFWSRAWMG